MKVYLAYAVAVLSIVLGFAALLLQRTYLDQRTGQVTSVELPFLGRLRTNYPALVFVALGIGLAVLALKASITDKWVLTGFLTQPSSKEIDWRSSIVKVEPSDIKTEVSREGKFTISADIEDGRSIDEVFDTLDFTHELGSVQIYLRQEHDHYMKNEKSRISNISGHTWTFAPAEITLYSGEVSN